MDGTETAALVAGVFAACIIISRFMFRSRSRPRRRNDTRDYPRDFGPQYDHSITPPATETWSMVLQVEANASAEEIRRAYRVLISKYHPDKMSEMEPAVREQAARRSQEINIAYRDALRARMAAG